MVHGGNVPIEWSEKNVIAKAPESNPATGGKSPSSKDKPKKVRRKRASAEKSKVGSPKPPAAIQSSSGTAPPLSPVS